MFIPRLFVVLLVSTQLPSIHCASADDYVTSLYRPWRAERVLLSPDGEHLAYTQNERGELAIYLMTVGQTEKKFRIAVESDRPVAFSKEKAPARLRFMQWASPSRLVFSPTTYFNGVRLNQSIFAVNLDGTNVKTLAESDDFSALGPSGKTFSRTTNIRGFPAGDRRSLLVEANGSSMLPTTLFAIDPLTGKKRELTEEVEAARYAYDQTGAVRLLYELPAYAPKRTFRYKLNGTWDRWVNMNEDWGGPVPKSFVVTVDNYYSERAYPLGFAADPDVLFYASNVGRDTYGIYAFDVKTKQRTAFAVEEPHVDLAPLEPGFTNSPLVIDEYSGQLAGVRAVGVVPFTRWVDPELAALQRRFDLNFSQRTVEILQWDAARRRFLLRVSGGTDPGRYHVFQRPENVFVEVLRSAPWIRNADLHAALPFEFDPPGGGHLTGHLTFPRKPRLNPPPLLIGFSDGVLGRAPSGFDREAQVLAEMGFVVARINVRGMSGFGRAHRDAIRTEGERAPIADAVAALDWIAAHYPVDRKRVATLGHGLGGYLALRAMQVEPDLFRCAVAIDAPLLPEAWLQPPMPNLGRGAEAPIRGVMERPPPMPPPPPINFAQEAQRAFFFKNARGLTSVLDTPERLTKPVLLIVNGRDSSTIATQNDSLQSKLKRLGHPADYVQAENSADQDLPGARAKTFRRIEEFFNLNLYDFGVKVGPSKEIK